jgi:hypothetical protein
MLCLTEILARAFMPAISLPLVLPYAPTALRRVAPLAAPLCPPPLPPPAERFRGVALPAGKP